MSQRTAYKPGTPCWCDLGSPDPAASARFYGELFGWEAEAAGPVEETGGYAMFKLNGRSVAGVGPLMSQDQPPVWSTYVATEDADATAARAREAGGNVIVEPMDVMDAGRMGFFADRTGAVIGIWQAGRTTGAELVNEPGTMCWNELACRDIDSAREFYSSVFGWVGATRDSENTTYTEWKLDDRTIGGMIEMNEQWPAEVPPHWMVYFAVEDCDLTAKRAEELGGTISVPPTTIPVGRFAVLGDPNSTAFSVISLSEAPPE